MQASRNPCSRCTAPVAVLLAFAAVAAPLRLAAAQTYAQKTTAAAEYIAAHADREDMVRMPMRDGVRLSATILFPNDRPRQNLPTVLIFFPYLIDGAIRSGWPSWGSRWMTYRRPYRRTTPRSRRDDSGASQRRRERSSLFR